MYRVLPQVALYQHRRTGDYVLERFGRSSRFPGALEPVAEERLPSQDPANCLARVNSALSTFWQGAELPIDWKSPDVHGLGPALYRRVSIRLLDDEGTLEIDPSQPGTRGGFVGSLPEERLRISNEMQSDESCRTLLEGFRRAK